MFATSKKVDVPTPYAVYLMSFCDFKSNVRSIKTSSFTNKRKSDCTTDDTTSDEKTDSGSDSERETDSCESGEEEKDLSQDQGARRKYPPIKTRAGPESFPGVAPTPQSSRPRIPSRVSLPFGRRPPSPTGDSGSIGDSYPVSSEIMIGDYPAEYNPKVHGPYDPARFYGKPDTPFGQVKVSEIGQWIARRNKHPKAMVSAISRFYWRWQQKYILPKRSGIAPLLQFVSTAMLFSYVINYYKIKHHYHFKYH